MNNFFRETCPILGKKGKTESPLEILPKSIKANPCPRLKEKPQLVKSLNTSQKVIETWFNNRRRRKSKKGFLKTSEWCSAMCYQCTVRTEVAEVNARVYRISGNLRVAKFLRISRILGNRKIFFREISPRGCVPSCTRQLAIFLFAKSPWNVISQKFCNA